MRLRTIEGSPLRRGIAIVLCVFLLLSGLLHASLTAGGIDGVIGGTFVASFDASLSDGRAGDVLPANEACPGALSCTAMIPAAEGFAFIHRTDARHVAIDDLWRSADAVQRLRPPKPSLRT